MTALTHLRSARGPVPRQPAGARPTPGHPVLALQRTIGNRATGGLLLRTPDPPTAADVSSAWRKHSKWTPEDRGETEDCAAAAKRIARLMGGDVAKMRTYRFSRSDRMSTAEERKAARSRGWRFRDRIVTGADGDFLEVWSGIHDPASGLQPTAHRYPLLPGMLIYTAEGADRDGKWSLRHMMMYAGDGKVQENFRSPRSPRDLTDRPGGDLDGAYGTGSFHVVLSIHDPFAERRGWWTKAWLELLLP